MVTYLRPYTSMRASGTQWLGEVPEHWQVLPNRALFIETKERGHPAEPMLSVTIARGVIRQEELLADTSKKDSSNQDRSTYKLVRPGDITYNKMRAWQGALGVSTHKGIVSPAYIVQRPRRMTSGCSDYYHHLLRTPAFAREAERWSYGITSDMWSLRPEHFKLIYSCLPPPSEQAAIVRFLDYVDRRIRRYIRAKEKLIALLEEQKQAVIHQAVTGEIDVRTGQPYPAYKDSGVEWLGEVPEHWGLSKLRHCAAVSGGMTPSMADRRFWDGQIPWVTPKDLKSREISDSILRITNDALEETSIRLVEPPAVLLVVRGMILARKVPIARTTVPVTLNQDMKALVPNREISASFLAAFLECAQDALRSLVDESGHGTRRLPTKHWRGVVVALPPLKEQEAIVAVIQSQVRRVTASVESALRQNRLVSEYKSRLAADVVTGKLDVRGAVAPLAEVDPPAVEDGLSAPLEPQPENPCRSDTDEVTEPANP